ncbi:Triacylglycerol esterase/lipase EstA, alpha/beta hydrolase fold [Rhodococcus maanshanensis]|uniref:Triacylglycerol esterase/lipase EstA, alpha/beta hydrolase fold n=2 Tax=Rhodococcus maanshanensis TaxID=183556 RepID=A0A1H7SSR0_9NOCA|nr:Triacylglycerol esterase/lipase EstA, alpha/beta hydrolase fold [Rhodococcus maanshanensis]
MFRAPRAAVLACSLIALMSSFGTVAADADPLPENFSYSAGFANERTNPGGSLPGSNDFGCKPTAAHPRPVVLVHGTAGGEQITWSAYVPMLKNAGFCVFNLTYGAIPGPWPISAVGAMNPIESSAQQLGEFVDRVLTATGASTVDIVGHSQGTLVPEYYAKVLGGQSTITNYVSLAPLWLGTKVSGGDGLPLLFERLGLPDTAFPICQACGQFVAGSELINKVNADGTPYLKGIEYTNIGTRYDEQVVPYTRGMVPGLPGYDVTNIVIQDGCEQDTSDHFELTGTKRAAYMVLNALDPTNPREVPCGRE